METFFVAGVFLLMILSHGGVCGFCNFFFFFLISLKLGICKHTKIR